MSSILHQTRNQQSISGLGIISAAHFPSPKCNCKLVATTVFHSIGFLFLSSKTEPHHMSPIEGLLHALFTLNHSRKLMCVYPVNMSFGVYDCTAHGIKKNILNKKIKFLLGTLILNPWKEPFLACQAFKV
jgi:hypothetical protein